MNPDPPRPREARAAPRCTYRVQFHAGFGFDDAAAIAAYLSALGVSHLYASPYLQAERGSTHGYDVVDPGRVNEDLGGAAGHDRLCQALGENGLGQVLDIVPNHMAISSRRNRWWWDVLENGPASRYASYFDVDWDPPESKLRNLVLLPILDKQFGRALEAGEIKLAREGGSFVFHCHDHVVPVAPRSLDDLLCAAAARCGSALLAFIADSYGSLPLATALDHKSVTRRHRDKEILRDQLDRLCREDLAARQAIDQGVAEINRDSEALDTLLARQNYRLAYWRMAGRDLGYRRFFDVNSLVGLRAEEERVFADTHALVLRWLAQGVLDGLRVDHPDGLRDPEAYFHRLRGATPDGWIVAEKILEPGEDLPRTWPIAGTTGYDFLSLVGALFVDPAAEAAMTRTYTDFTGEPGDWPTVARDKKRQVARALLGSDINRVTAAFLDVCERHRCHRDHTRHELHEVVTELLASFPVYRTYVRIGAAGPAVPSEQDARYIHAAIDDVRKRRKDLDGQLLDFFRDLLLQKFPGAAEAELVMRLQQLTGPAMAKGIEDTAFYCYNRLVCLNEVGGDPGRFGVSVQDFHRACEATQTLWPGAMLATSTHDTKRSGDVRARLALLSEIPQAWQQAVKRWSAHNRRHKSKGMPDANAEYLFYQTLVGAWPLEEERAVAYMQKAAREAKVHTSWTDPKPAYEDALGRFVGGALHDADFLADLAGFVAPLVAPGRACALAQTLIQLTAPGVPDLYQGTELWDLSLVDPDNRRPVDYALRRKLLAELHGLTTDREVRSTAVIDQIMARSDEGLPKLFLIHAVLHLRRRRPAWFAPGSAYRPLFARGKQAHHLVAFCRGDSAITLAPRLIVQLAAAGGFGDTTLDLPESSGPWYNELTGEDLGPGPVALDAVLRRFPVALLVRDKTHS